ncbi:hypothetical protein PQ478_09425 [Alkalihalophilus pseudofirmus]|uniref:hypothetical protein n=1 Tax=Alkalihalophilus pseudofirmus TaxID=79885 RepID=UPI00259B0064|nr:hypothetical protein [Alkalihalophilus pseudofirmus]WEG18688.1 hypothetical protein PQ478_09425 [Alkalihalophilus pseudofirmus]
MSELNPNITNDYKHCNHHHELTENHRLVDFGDGEFVANVDAIPLLKALSDLGLRTRTHHVDKDGGFFSILVEPNVSFFLRQVNEVDSDRTKYNGKTEVLISWHNEMHDQTN